jgi:hypothetical protein
MTATKTAKEQPKAMEVDKVPSAEELAALVLAGNLINHFQVSFLQNLFV